ncbi:MAG: YihY/virulence factor BrkB family protein [Anaerolineae bacterium]|nr:YihY/virulence factor BrkB family protein [Anaerolineae bacterium]
MNTLKTFLKLVEQTYNEWKEDKASRIAAALAYYTAFSLAPLLVVIVAVVGFIVNEETVRSRILTEVRLAIGSDAAEFVGDLLNNVNHPAEGVLSTILGIATLLIGSIGALGQLRGALNTIWDVDEQQVKRKTRFLGIGKYLKEKLFSFGILLTLGFFMMVSLTISTLLAALDTYIMEMVPEVELLLHWVSNLVTFGLITVLFALMYKFIPDTKVQWRDVWIGAAITALLFTIGKYLLGLYLGYTSTASVYGAAGSFVLILLWIYYSAQIVLFGAEFTQVYARRVGVPAASAEIESWDKARQALEADRALDVIDAEIIPPDVSIPQATYAHPTSGKSSIGWQLKYTQSRTPPKHSTKNVLVRTAFSIGAFAVALVAGVLRFRNPDTPQ